MLTFEVTGTVKGKGFASSPQPDQSTDQYSLGSFYAALRSTLLSLYLRTDDGLVHIQRRTCPLHKFNDRV